MEGKAELYTNAEIESNHRNALCLAEKVVNNRKRYW